jgi:DNA repair protein RadC
MPSKRQRLQELKGSWTASELSIQYKPGLISDKPIKNSSDAYAFILSVWDKERINMQEQFMAFFHHEKGKTIGYRVICTGLAHTVHVDIKLIASLALHTLASNVILAHNHPSGSLEPSTADITTTKQIKKALNLISVKLWDHLIINENDYLSMSDEGLI